MAKAKKGSDAVREAKPSELKALAKKRNSQEDANSAFPRPIQEFPDLEDCLPEMCARYREIAVQMAALEKERKELSEQIEPLMAAVEWNSITGDGWHAIRSRGRHKSISAEKLAENGVDMDVIEASTTIREYWYVQVREVGVDPPSIG